MDKLTTSEAAWVLGGAERAALVTFVALATDGRLDVAYQRQRVKVVRAEAGDPVEAAALALIPESGLGVADLVRQLAGSPAVAELEAAVRAKGLRRFLRRFSPAYRELIQHPGSGVRRVAVLGVPGIEDERLRYIFEHPRPVMPRIDPMHPVRDNTTDGTLGPSPGTDTTSGW